MTIKKTSPENAADVEAMKQMLQELSSGTIQTYEAMSDSLGRDVRARFWLLRKAIREAEAETGALFEVVRTVGIKRLATEEAPDVGLTCIRKIRRTAKRGVDRLGTVRANDLTQDQHNRLIAHRSQLGAISLVADGRKSITLAAEAAKTGQTIPAGRVLELFKG